MRVLIPPGRNARLSLKPSAALRERNRNIRSIRELGRREWHTSSGYSKRSMLENTVLSSRDKAERRDREPEWELGWLCMTRTCITTCNSAGQRWRAPTSAESPKSPYFQRSRAPTSALLISDKREVGSSSLPRPTCPLSYGRSDVGIRRNSEPVRHRFGKVRVAAGTDLFFA